MFPSRTVLSLPPSAPSSRWVGKGRSAGTTQLYLVFLCFHLWFSFLPEDRSRSNCGLPWQSSSEDCMPPLQGHGIDPWLGMPRGAAKRKKNKKRREQLEKDLRGLTGFAVKVLLFCIFSINSLAIWDSCLDLHFYMFSLIGSDGWFCLKQPKCPPKSGNRTVFLALLHSHWYPLLTSLPVPPHGSLLVSHT